MSDPQTVGGAEGGASSLEIATQLARQIDAGWAVGLYPDAGEAAGTFQYRAKPGRCAVPGPAIDPNRSASEAERRARTRVRRYVAANRLDRLGTLTYSGEGLHDERELRRHVRHFFRRLRSELGGAPLPYVWVPEWHKTDHGLHVHLALGRYVPQPLLAETWGRGFVHIKRLGRHSGGSLASSRRAAGYVSKYIGKSFERERISHSHRYDLAQGFAPRVERITATSRDEVIRLAADRMGREPAELWTSAEAEHWKGPSAVWMGWDD